MEVVRIVEDIESFPEVVKWLRGKKKGTVSSYLSALRVYVEYAELTPTELIDEADEDREKPRRHRGAPEGRVMGFYQWLLEEYEQKARGFGGGRTGKIGVSEKLAGMYCAAMRSFYKANGFELGREGAVLSIPKGSKKRVNFKLKFRQKEMRKLFDVCTCLRDKTIVLAMYQSFQAVSEICSLNYGDVHRGLENGDKFITIHMIRKKREVEYYTILGEETLDLLRLYLDERKKNGDVLEFDTPLFTKEGAQLLNHSGITPNLIENSFRKYALKAGLVTEKQLEVADLNPARPHALRSSGMTVAKLSGMNETAVEFISGHNLDETTQAYWMAHTEELETLYKKHYHALRVLKPKLDTEKIRALEDDSRDKGDIIRALIENGKMKEAKLTHLEGEFKKLREDFDTMMAYLTEKGKRRILGQREGDVR